MKFLEFISKGQMATLKSISQPQNKIKTAPADNHISEQVSTDERTAEVQKIEIETDSFLTVIRRAKEAAHTVSEPAVWGTWEKL